MLTIEKLRLQLYTMQRLCREVSLGAIPLFMGVRVKIGSGLT